MKSLFKVITLVLVIGFASCTNENKVVPTAKEQQLHEQELFGTNKEDVNNPGGSGEEDPDYTEG
ncbi:hypothetical protein P8625_14275 [Tenacibaculum tangerinum]|uniref:Uncharacterized protein n=1 Tax=Tenacibaculum tangerinum TaxID=3038772 RepID=A0ABY8L4U8_9FLAO|nr:hypothetical protein [Tenacibaculum tangerinum]WGH75223.1 hypothetical protein P8625_14275 [Tenacibaculum tangerinum]